MSFNYFIQKRNIVISFLVVFFLSIPALLQGRVRQAPATQINWPPSPMGTDIGPTTQFHELIQYSYEWGISLGGIAVFIMFVWAGIEYLTSAGDPGKMKEAINRIRSSVLGLILLLTSWLVLNTINPRLVQLRPLPYLDERGVFYDFGVDQIPRSAPPCDFVVIYSQIGWQGKPGLPIRFQKPALPDTDYLEVIRIERAIHAAGDGFGSDFTNTPISTLENHANPWASARGFVELTKNEIEKINNGTLDIVRYDRDGNKIGRFDRSDPESQPAREGQYKEGGFCSIAIFFTTRRWFAVEPCGGRLAVSNLPIRDFNEIRFRPDEITCAEVSRTIPQIPPSPPTDPTLLLAP